jgi:hypothetical protein
MLPEKYNLRRKKAYIYKPRPAGTHFWKSGAVFSCELKLTLRNAGLGLTWRHSTFKNMSPKKTTQFLRNTENTKIQQEWTFLIRLILRESACKAHILTKLWQLYLMRKRQTVIVRYSYLYKWLYTRYLVIHVGRMYNSLRVSFL